MRFRRKKSSPPVPRRPSRLARIFRKSGYAIRVLLLLAALGFVIWTYQGDVYVALVLAICAGGLFIDGIAPMIVSPLVRWIVRTPFALGALIPLWGIGDALLRGDMDALTHKAILGGVYGLAVLILLRLPRHMSGPFEHWLPDRTTARPAARREYASAGAGRDYSQRSTSGAFSSGSSRRAFSSSAGSSSSDRAPSGRTSFSRPSPSSGASRRESPRPERTSPFERKPEHSPTSSGTQRTTRNFFSRERPSSSDSESPGRKSGESSRRKSASPSEGSKKRLTARGLFGRKGASSSESDSPESPERRGGKPSRRTEKARSSSSPFLSDFDAPGTSSSPFLDDLDDEDTDADSAPFLRDLKNPTSKASSSAAENKGSTDKKHRGLLNRLRRKKS